MSRKSKKNKDKDIIIAKIKELMKEKNVTAYRLAKESGVSHALVSRMLNGITKPTKPYSNMLNYLLSL